MKNILRSLGVTLALSAMLLRALLPVGWMPNPTGTDRTAFVICTAQGALQLPAGHDRGLPTDHGGQACPFGAAVPFAPPQMAVLVPLPAWGGLHVAAVASPRPRTVRPSYSVHAPRAPPVFA